MNINRLFCLIFLCLSVSTACLAERLVILHTNDTHSQIDPASDGLGGVARRKALIDSVRAVENNVLLVDAGDIVQGTLYFNIFKGEVEEMVMNALGYDLRILGNHEFDNGLEALAANLDGAEASLLGTNYQIRDSWLEGLLSPALIYQSGDKLIGFMGLNLDPKGMIAPDNYKGMGYVDAIEAANHMAWMLKNIAQVDYVVALSHLGYDTQDQPSDVALVKASKDIDLVIGGHTHTTIDPSDPNSVPHRIKNAEGRDVLVAQTGRYGKYVGEIMVDLDSLDVVPQYRLISVDSRWDDRLDEDFVDMLRPYREEVDALNSRVVAKTAKALDQKSDALLNFGSDFVRDRGHQLADDVDFAILNKGGLRNGLPKGDVTEGQLITMMPFANRIVVLEITGADLLDAFDVMAAADGNGVSAEVDATYDPATNKAVSVRVSGKEINLSDTYRVATIDYLANGGDYMWPLTKGSRIATSDSFMYEDLIAHFKSKKGRHAIINPSDTKRMRPIK